LQIQSSPNNSALQAGYDADESIASEGSVVSETQQEVYLAEAQVNVLAFFFKILLATTCLSSGIVVDNLEEKMLGFDTAKCLSATKNFLSCLGS